MDNNSIHHGTGCRSAACTLLAAPAHFKQQFVMLVLVHLCQDLVGEALCQIENGHHTVFSLKRGTVAARHAIRAVK